MPDGGSRCPSTLLQFAVRGQHLAGRRWEWEIFEVLENEFETPAVQALEKSIPLQPSIERRRRKLRSRVGIDNLAVGRPRLPGRPVRNRRQRA
jgi:hypothetical protein